MSSKQIDFEFVKGSVIVSWCGNWISLYTRVSKDIFDDKQNLEVCQYMLHRIVCSIVIDRTCDLLHVHKWQARLRQSDVTWTQQQRRWRGGSLSSLHTPHLSTTWHRSRDVPDRMSRCPRRISLNGSFLTADIAGWKVRRILAALDYYAALISNLTYDEQSFSTVQSQRDITRAKYFLR